MPTKAITSHPKPDSTGWVVLTCPECKGEWYVAARDVRKKERCPVCGFAGQVTNKIPKHGGLNE